MSENHQSPNAVEEHVRDTYLAQLPARLAQLKELYVDRQWARLRRECEKLAHGAERHGLADVARAALEVVRHIPVQVDTPAFSLDDPGRLALGELFESAHLRA